MGRNIGGGVERFIIGSGEDGEGPSACSAIEELMQLLVVFIDVGTFFTVDLDTDKVLIDELSDLGIFKYLMFHYMAPMAAAVSDRDKNRFMLMFRPFECFIAPWIPIQRVVFVLLQIGGILKYKSIGHKLLHIKFR
jgi:hypothetical protein